MLEHYNTNAQVVVGTPTGEIIADMTLDRDQIVELTFEEQLRELAKRVREGERLNLYDYYPLLAFLNGFTLVPCDGEPSQFGRVEIEHVQYLLLFTSEKAAERIASRTSDAVVKAVIARRVLESVPDGSGVVMDWGTDAELRISPDSITELNEEFRFRHVRQHASEEWLVKVNSDLARDGVELGKRASRAKEIWKALNGFRVLPGSRRDRRIDLFFDVQADADSVAWPARIKDKWIRDYQSDTYLHHLNSVDLVSRGEGISRNLLFCDRKSLPHELSKLEWQELLQHVICEFQRRGSIHTIASPDANAVWPNSDRASGVFTAYAGPPGQLFRFSKRQYLEPLLATGEMLLFPASKYLDDPSLTPPQSDDELGRTILADGTKTHITHIDRDGVRREIKATGSIRSTLRSRTNYYVLCMTTSFEPRLFDDFNRSDACLIIHNAPLFTDRLIACVARALPRWIGADKLVRYFDPLRSHNQVLATYEKDFRYAYQREYRFAWGPPFPEIHRFLDPVRLHLGPLSDVASLIKL